MTFATWAHIIYILAKQCTLGDFRSQIVICSCCGLHNLLFCQPLAVSLQSGQGCLVDLLFASRLLGADRSLCDLNLP